MNLTSCVSFYIHIYGFDMLNEIQSNLFDHTEINKMYKKVAYKIEVKFSIKG